MSGAKIRFIPLVVAALTGIAGGAPLLRAQVADDDASVEFFEKEVRPVLVRRCYECHSAERTKGGLALDSRTGLRKGGDSGPVIVPGQPEKSLLIDAINYGDLKMPPEDKG